MSAAIAVKTEVPTLPANTRASHLLVSLPKPLSRNYVWATTLIAPLFVIVVNGIMLYLLYGEAHLHWPPTIFLYLATAAMVYKIVTDAARRRLDNIRRMQVVAECNHHIRNSLQSMVSLAYVNGKYAAGYQEIRDAVDRIEHTLTDILPGVTEE